MAIDLPVIGDQSVRKQFDELLTYVSFGATNGLKAGNMDGHWKEATSHAVANTEFSITHHLNRVPTGYLIGQRNKAGIIYNGSTTWTDSLIYLKCDVTEMTFRVFIW